MRSATKTDAAFCRRRFYSPNREAVIRRHAHKTKLGQAPLSPNLSDRKAPWGRFPTCPGCSHDPAAERMPGASGLQTRGSSVRSWGPTQNLGGIGRFPLSGTMCKAERTGEYFIFCGNEPKRLARTRCGQIPVRPWTLSNPSTSLSTRNIFFFAKTNPGAGPELSP